TDDSAFGLAGGCGRGGPAARGLGCAHRRVALPDLRRPRLPSPIAAPGRVRARPDRRRAEPFGGQRGRGGAPARHRSRKSVSPDAPAGDRPVTSPSSSLPLETNCMTIPLLPPSGWRTIHRVGIFSACWLLIVLAVCRTTPAQAQDPARTAADSVRV